MTLYRIATNAMALAGKLPQGDPRWATFNDSFVNRELDLTSIANEIYTGHAYTTQHNGRRKSENFVAGQHIAVEFDTEDERSTYPFIMNNMFAATYAALWHTTPSHTDTAPRSRLIFLLDQPITDRQKYENAVAAVLTFFPWADQSTKDGVRFFYGAKNCAIEMMTGNELPLAHLRAKYAQWCRKHPQRKTIDRSRIIRMDDARAQRVAQTTYGDDLPPLDDFERALRTIDPYSLDYNRWIGYIKAARDDYGDAAFSIIEAWAQGKPGEVAAIWKRNGANGGKMMHVNTIFYMARNG